VTFADRLTELAEARTTAERVTAPGPGWEPGIRYEPDGTRVVTSGPIPETDDPAPVLASMGVTVPDGFRARLAEVRHDPAAWTRAAQGEDAVTIPVVRCRWVIEPAPSRIDVDELLRAVKPRRKAAEPVASATCFVFAAGDLQLGKPDGDGSAGTVQRFYDSLDRALTRYKRLRKARACDPVALLWAGDCIEGTESQGSRLLARLDLTVTEQVRVYRRLMAEQVTAFTDLADDVTVAVVPGNHDEAKRVGDKMATRYDDSWAIEGAAQVADVMAAKGRTVQWAFPGRDGLHLTIDISGTRVGLLHGHQTRGKYQSWLGGKALGRDAIGTADVVVTGHYHSLLVEHLGPTTHMRVGALDGGSTWYEHRGNPASPPAALTFLTADGKWHGLEVV